MCSVMEVFIWGVFFGIIGMGYFSFGRKQNRLVFLLTGTSLMLFPYFVEGFMSTVTVGAFLLILPFVVMKFSH